MFQLQTLPMQLSDYVQDPWLHELLLYSLVVEVPSNHCLYFLMRNYYFDSQSDIEHSMIGSSE